MLSWIIGLGVPAKFARPLLIAAGVVLLIMALGAGKCAYDKRVVENANAGQEAATAKADRKADTKAAEERRADDARAVTESQEIKEAITDAGPDPIARRRAYYDCVVRQQAARRDGKPPADC